MTLGRLLYGGGLPLLGCLLAVGDGVNHPVVLRPVEAAAVYSDLVTLKAAVQDCLDIDPTGNDCGSNDPMSSWDVSEVTSMRRLFEYKAEFNADISGWNVAK